MTRPVSAQRQQERRDSVVAAVTASDPALSADLVTDVVERVAATPGARARLAGYLLEHPDALTDGHSRPPRSSAH